MKPFTPINFGSLWLALKRDRQKRIPKDFVFSLRNTPRTGYTQRLHFYNTAGTDNQSLYRNLAIQLRVPTSEMLRPWSENLLIYIEGGGREDIVLDLDDVVVIRDGFPKVNLYRGFFFIFPE